MPWFYLCEFLDFLAHFSCEEFFVNLLSFARNCINIYKNFRNNKTHSVFFYLSLLKPLFCYLFANVVILYLAYSFVTSGPLLVHRVRTLKHHTRAAMHPPLILSGSKQSCKIMLSTKWRRNFFTKNEYKFMSSMPGRGNSIENISPDSLWS